MLSTNARSYLQEDVYQIARTYAITGRVDISALSEFDIVRLYPFTIALMSQLLQYSAEVNNWDYGTPDETLS